MPDSPLGPCPLACPICERVLRREGSAYRCELGHSFDIAREGYVNLLPPQHKSRGIEGDVASMLHARRRFLEAGHYRPLLDALSVRVEALAAGEASPCVAEVGCGEGYYIGNIAAAVGPQRAAFLGTDLSKAAVRLAAKRYPDVLFFVSDVHRRLYLPDGGLDALLDIFAPRDPAEFARVLRPAGIALVVLPAESHLASARTALGLLGIEAEKERRVIERFAEDFRLSDRRQLAFSLELDADAVADLVGMGPSHWHRAGAPVYEGASLQTEASFVLLELERRAAR